jgi:Ca-activated chloride channel family protein
MFELAFPWALLALPVPLLLWLILPRAVIQFPASLKIPFFNDMVSMIEHQAPHVAEQAQYLLFYLIWTLIVVALAGPRWIGEPQPVSREGYNIMLALDVSGSMELGDMMAHGRPVTRLAVVKHAAEQFVNDRVGDKIGLILFGSQAYLLTPLTYDRQSVLMRLDDATVGLAGKTTAIGDAIGLAVKRFQQVPPTGRVIILLTDGVNNSGVLAPLKAAELARADGIKIYTIGLGVDLSSQSIGGLFYNMNAAAELDEDTLKEVAKMTGGRYFRATDLQSLQSIYKSIDRMEKLSQDEETIRPQNEYYPWPLAIALFLFFYALASKAHVWSLWRFIRPEEDVR